jgi:hypothetical protein
MVEFMNGTKVAELPCEATGKEPGTMATTFVVDDSLQM